MRKARNFLLLSFCSGLILFSSSARAATVKVTSTPSGAKVEIDGIVVGTTPFEMKVPGGYFHKTRSVFGARLEHPMVLRVSKEGYATKEIVMTEGPMRWIALNGADHGDYWLLKTDHFDVTLDSLSTSFTGTITATMADNSTMRMRPELSVEQIVAQSEPAVVLLRRPDGQGTGFFITDSGVIATNAHVARGEQSLVAVTPNGQKLEAEVVYIDPNVDIAFLKVEGTGFPHLRLADVSAVHQGQTVVAIGNPGTRDAVLCHEGYRQRNWRGTKRPRNLDSDRRGDQSGEQWRTTPERLRGSRGNQHGENRGQELAESWVCLEFN